MLMGSDMHSLMFTAIHMAVRQGRGYFWHSSNLIKDNLTSLSQYHIQGHWHPNQAIQSECKTLWTV